MTDTSVLVSYKGRMVTYDEWRRFRREEREIHRRIKRLVACGLIFLAIAFIGGMI